MNTVMLAGNVVRDPETRQTANDTKVTNITIATNKRVKGEDRAEYHRCVAFNKTAELIGEYMHKGSYIIVTDGELQTRQWEKDGEKRYSTEVLINRFEFGPKTGVSSESSGSRQVPANAENVAVGAKEQIEDLDDEIPF